MIIWKHRGESNCVTPHPDFCERRGDVAPCLKCGDTAYRVTLRPDVPATHMGE